MAAVEGEGVCCSGADAEPGVSGCPRWSPSTESGEQGPALPEPPPGPRGPPGGPSLWVCAPEVGHTFEGLLCFRWLVGDSSGEEACPSRTDAQFSALFSFWSRPELMLLAPPPQECNSGLEATQCSFTVWGTLCQKAREHSSCHQ